MHRRLLPFCAVGLAVVFAVLLSCPSSSASAPIAEADHSLQRSTTSSITTITTDTITIPTYPYAAHLYTATNTTYNIPYQWLHWAEYEGSHPQPVNQIYTRLTLENEWLRVSVLPQLGGRVYELIYKPTASNELYQNPVIKPTHWGPPEQGWWLAAGGIEWGLPVEEHGYESAIPWLYDVITGTDGITITVRDSTAPDRLRAAIAIYLPNDRAALTIRPRIENDRDVGLNFKWWLNAMLAPGPSNTVGRLGHNPDNVDLRFVYPTDQVTVHSTGDSTLPPANQPMAWPFYKNRDLSRLQNWGSWLGFFARPAASQDFAAVLNDNGSGGLIRVFPHTIATGLKGFGMGYGNPIGAAEWTDDDSYYVELHGGLAPTFGDTVPIGAHQAIEWEETWYGPSELENVSSANRDAALSIKQWGFHLIAGVYSPQLIDSAQLTVWRRSTCERLGDMAVVNLQPAMSQYTIVPTTLPVEDITALFTQADRVVVGYNVPDDGTPPTAVGISAPTPYVTQSEIPITLLAADQSCVRSFDVQVKDGLYGAWTDWLTGTPTTTHTYTGIHGHTYFFRARARDLAGNVSAYHSDMWGDAYSSVLLTPAPILELSYKLAPIFSEAGQPIGYTINVSNTGALTAAVTITDTLPPLTTLITASLGSSLPPLPTVTGNQIIWSGSVPTGTGVTFIYNLQPDAGLPLATMLTNTVEIEGSVLPISRTARVVVNPYRTWLPLIMR
jgi:uncharacterized repeat protein (TIGR01451 family)